MTKATTYKDNSSVHIQSYITFSVKGDIYSSGVAFTAEGFVRVWQWGPTDLKPNGTSSLQFIYKARFYSRLYNNAFTERGLAVKASQFAREIIKKEGEK